MTATIANFMMIPFVCLITVSKECLITTDAVPIYFIRIVPLVQSGRVMIVTVTCVNRMHRWRSSTHKVSFILTYSILFVDVFDACVMEVESIVGRY